MSEEGKSVQDLEKRVEGLTKNLEEFHELLAKGKQMRWILVIALLLVIGVVVFMIFGLKKKVTDVDPSKLVAMVNERAQVIVDSNKEYLMNAVKEAYPQVTQKIQSKITEQAPKLKDKAAKEVDLLIENLQKGVEKQVEKELKALERDIRTTVGKEFPGLNDEKVAKMVENFQKAVEEVCIDFASEYFAEHASVLLDIDKTLEDFTATTADKLPANREKLIEELKSVVVLLFNIKLAQMVDAEG
jgi:hypothetical protein